MKILKVVVLSMGLSSLASAGFLEDLLEDLLGKLKPKLPPKHKPKPPQKAPEISLGSAGTAIALLSGGVLVLRGRRKE